MIGANDITGANDAISANVANGIIYTIIAIEIIVAIGIIFNIATIAWPICCHCRHWSPLVPSTFIGYCNLHIVIVISANGDRHWRQWRWGAPLATVDPSPLAPMDRHEHHFLSPLVQMAPMARIPNRNDTFALSAFLF